MADQTFRSTDKSGAPFEKATSAAKTLADQALAAGRDLKEKAAGMAGSSTEAIKDRASDAMDAAKGMASQATDKLKQTVDDQKNQGADYVGNLADTMRRAAREFDHDLPIAGAYIRKAASQIEGVSDQIKTGNFSDLVSGAQAFARRQPTAFLGLAVLAGFGAVRFLKSSANSSDASSGSGHDGGAGFTPNQASRSHSDNLGYRDEFTK
jgi:gas vesicle protein